MKRVIGEVTLRKGGVMPGWLTMMIGIPLILVMLSALLFMAVASIAPFAVAAYEVGLAGADSLSRWLARRETMRQVADRVQRGEKVDGAKLPPVRQLTAPHARRLKEIGGAGRAISKLAADVEKETGGRVHYDHQQWGTTWRSYIFLDHGECREFVSIAEAREFLHSARQRTVSSNA